MFLFERISGETAQEKCSNSACTIIDIRDEMSFNNGHIPNALHIDNSNLAQFIDSADQELPLLIYCYHGNSSQSAAQMLAQQGFSEVYSVDGGYDAWLQAIK